MRQEQRLAIDGGPPVRGVRLPYGRHSIEQPDVDAVVDVLRSSWLTTGPKVGAFEQSVAAYVSARAAVAVSSGTAALHAAMHALGIGPGDEVIVPAMTFAATANAVLFQGGTPVFADVESNTLLLDPNDVSAKISPRTKAVVAVDYAGQPCAYDELRGIVNAHGIALVADACHALGATYKGRPVGSIADLTVFSFHPVKHITTGEGGMVTIDNPEFARRARRFRNHGISTEHREREAQETWFYEMEELGYNYRLTDFQCALGAAQMRRLPAFLQRRQEIADSYRAALAKIPAVRPLAVHPGVTHAYHLFVVRLDLSGLSATRAQVFTALRMEGIGVNVHYIPVHLHPYYRRVLKTGPGLCPVAEAAYECILSLPIFPEMSDQDIADVITAIGKVINAYELRPGGGREPASTGVLPRSGPPSQDDIQSLGDNGVKENGNMRTPRVRLRPADRHDSRLLFGWVNLPEVRAASFSSDPIPFSEHQAWYERKLADCTCRIFIALDEKGGEVGVVRFEREGDDAIVSVTVAPTHRGQGYAPIMITAACCQANLPGIKRFVAEIKDGHKASEHAFARARFKLFQHIEKQGTAAIQMELPVVKV
jgi:perosamine synthetase